MSTSLHHGYKLALSLDELAPAFRELQRSIKEADQRAFYTHAATRLATILDTINLKDKFVAGTYNTTESISPFQQVQLATRAEREAIRISGGRSSEDYETNWVIFPQPSGQMLALLFTEQDHVRKIWESHPAITPYPYWDNCEGPEDVSDQNWELRGKEWDQALPTDIPATSGLTFQVYSEYQGPRLPEEAHDLLPYFPELSARINTAHKERGFFIYSLKQPYVKPDSISRWVNDYKGWGKSEVGASCLQILRDHIKGTLPATYHSSNLTTSHELYYPDSVRFPTRVTMRNHGHNGEGLGYRGARLNLHEVTQLILHLSEGLSTTARSRTEAEQATTLYLSNALFDLMSTSGAKIPEGTNPPTLYRLPELP
jgi:hypothetical protein